MDTDVETLLKSLHALLLQEQHRADQKLQRELGALYAELGEHGVYYGSSNVLRTKQVYEQDIENRAASLLSTLERLLVDVRPKLRHELGPPLRAATVKWLGEHVDLLQDRLFDHARKLRFAQRDSLDLGRQRVLAAIEVEIDLLLALAPKASKTHGLFVDLDRVDQLRELVLSDFDLSRLIRLCEELNTCFQHGCFHAVAMLTRAVLDHIPPLFDQRTFKEVAAQYPGGRSFKQLADSLEQGARKVTDGLLHAPIRSSETLPTLTQIDVRNQFDSVLAEIIRRFAGSGASAPA